MTGAVPCGAVKVRERKLFLGAEAITDTGNPGAVDHDLVVLVSGSY